MLTGIDVYAGSGTIDWKQVRASGVAFCFIRAAYGDQADEMAASHLAGAKAEGIVCGVYHFLRCSKDAATQVALMQTLLATLGVGKGDLPPVVDVEDNPAFDGAWKVANNAGYLVMLGDWVRTVQKATGREPTIYTRAGFWRELGNPSGFSTCPLWVASYRSPPPTLPSGWPAYTYWQYSDQGGVPGVSGDADVNYFRSGDPAELRAQTL